MSISIWILCDPGLHIPFSEHMENQCMQTPDLMEAGFRSSLVDTSGVDKQWDGSKLPTPVKTGGTLCCTAGGAVSRHLEAPNRAQPPGARPCLETARIALICCFTSFISSHFYFMKKKEISHSALGDRNKHLHFHFIFVFYPCYFTLPSSQPHCMYQQVQCHDLWQRMCPLRFFPFAEGGMRAKFHVRKG